MPNRMLRPYCDSLKFDGIDASAERLWVRLLTVVDDFGRFHGEPRLIKASCFPLIDNLRPADVLRWLDDLSTRHLILRYKVRQREYLAITNFRQRTRQATSKFPPPDGKPPDWRPTDDGQLTVTCQSTAHGDGDGDGGRRRT